MFSQMGTKSKEQISSQLSFKKLKMVFQPQRCSMKCKSGNGQQLSKILSKILKGILRKKKTLHFASSNWLIMMMLQKNSQRCKTNWLSRLLQMCSSNVVMTSLQAIRWSFYTNFRRKNTNYFNSVKKSLRLRLKSIILCQSSRTI